MKMKKYTLIFNTKKQANEFYTIFGGKENKLVSLDNMAMTAKLAYNPNDVYTNKIKKQYGIKDIK